MATLIQLSDANQLVRVDPVLHPGALEQRVIYLLPRVVEWMEKTLPTALPQKNKEETPIMQMDSLIERFCSGESLVLEYGFKILYPRDKCIWELKTDDLRVFGWFPQRDTFIVSACGITAHVKKHQLYRGFIDQTVRDRELLDLDPPKFIPGEDPDDLISTWHTR